MRLLLFLLLLLSTLPGWGQQASSTQSVTVSGPMPKLPLLASLSIMPQHLHGDDSLQQLAYRRNRVKSVTLLQVRSNGSLDTVDYTELNRQGCIVYYRPKYGQAYRQRYNRRQQLVEKTIYPFMAPDMFLHATYDPATKLTTTQRGPSLQQLATVQLVRSMQHGDTTSVEGFLYPNPEQPPTTLHRIVSKYFRAGRDTSRLEVLGYDAAGQVVQFESYYQFDNHQRRTEHGEVRFGAIGAPASVQWRSSQHTHGRYIPRTRYTYNANGHLVRTLLIPSPEILHKKPVIETVKNGQATVSTSAATDTSSVRYVRAPQGQLLREENWFTMPDFNNPGQELRKLSFVEYTYSPTGLRQTKVGSLPAHYVYRYTFY